MRLIISCSDVDSLIENRGRSSSSPCGITVSAARPELGADDVRARTVKMHGIERIAGDARGSETVVGAFSTQGSGRRRAV